jgi:hypothetical protein
MIPASDLASVRTVEDIVLRKPDGEITILGTKVGDQILSTDKDTLFPLQSALGYEITQSLFLGPDTVLVEGPSDILYFQLFSKALADAGREGLDRRWTICPVGGVDKIASFVALFGGNKLNIAVVIDYASGNKKRIEDLRKGELVRDGSRVLLATDFLSLPEADIEDLIGRAAYLRLVDSAYQINKSKSLEKALAGNQASRVVKDVEGHFMATPDLASAFSHYVPANWLLLNPGWIGANQKELEPAFDRFERLFKKLNGMLSAQLRAAAQS